MIANSSVATCTYVIHVRELIEYEYLLACVKKVIMSEGKRWEIGYM